ncbi:MAG: glycoside hydrolase family 43 protein [Phycisphaerae bacterium]
MNDIRNPILPGFHPDPSICRVGEDFYIANSSFEWFPGVTIHHSRDLRNWRLIARPLDRVSQLDMAGNPDSGGIWAPCLTWADGMFWLIYTDVKSLNGAFKDTPNYLVTAPEITGPWSEPIYLNSSGFDPSLFHDDDGRKWLVNQLWDYRPGRHPFKGIVMQEYSHEMGKLIGEREDIFPGTELKVTEGPHLYKRNGYYYLLTAEGGTGVNHAVTIARSKDIHGPYEVDPENPMLTAKDKDCRLQKAGHADFTDTPTGEWYMVHLASRPVKEGRCPLGRETAIQKVHWTDDGWVRLVEGGNAPQDVVAAPDLEEHPFEGPPARDDFDSADLPLRYQSLRVPIDESWASLTERPGFLRLYGREGLSSTFRQSLIARRVQSFHCEASTRVEYEPRHFHQSAGLVAYYNTQNWIYLHVTHDEDLGVCIKLLSNHNSDLQERMEPIHIGARRRISLRCRVEQDEIRFFVGGCGCGDDENWLEVGEACDFSKLSDDYVNGWGFTGAFVGMACQDLDGTRLHADFDYFEYKELD